MDRLCYFRGGYIAVIFYFVSMISNTAALRASELDLGQTLDGLLLEARQLNPELVAASLDAEAALAAVRGSDSLPDPEFQLESENNGFRGQPGTRTYWIGQEFLLGGKLGLRRSVAISDGERITAKREQTRVDLETRIKFVQAERYRWQATIVMLRDLHQDFVLTERVAAAVSREGRARQADIIRARMASINHQADQSRATAEYRQLDARLNLLLGRGVGQALLPPADFAPMPDSERLQDERLFALMRERNFTLAEQAATVRMGEAQVELAKREWVPNVKLQLGLDESQGRGVTGYEGFLTVNIPLRTERRQGNIAAENSKLSAAKARRDFELLKLESAISEQLIILRTTTGIEALLREEALPQARAGEQSLRRLYQEGAGDLSDVLAAQIERRKTEVEWLKVQSEMRQQLAELERLIGGGI